MGPIQALYRGGKLFGIVIVGWFVATAVGPIVLGAVTGAAGIWIDLPTVYAISAVAGLLVMGWLSS